MVAELFNEIAIIDRKVSIPQVSINFPDKRGYVLIIDIYCFLFFLIKIWFFYLLSFLFIRKFRNVSRLLFNCEYHNLYKISRIWIIAKMSVLRVLVRDWHRALTIVFICGETLVRAYCCTCICRLADSSDFFYDRGSSLYISEIRSPMDLFLELVFGACIYVYVCNPFCNWIARGFDFGDHD